MNKIVKFNNMQTWYLGRNGFGKCIGLDMLLTGDGTTVMISPINSKDNVARCEIVVPIDDLTEIIAALEKIKVEIRNG